MPKSKGMEYMHEFVVLDDLTEVLGELSQQQWELITVTSVHANAYELGERAHVLAVLKRPIK